MAIPYPITLPKPLLKGYSQMLEGGFVRSSFEQGVKQRPKPFKDPILDFEIMLKTKDEIITWYQFYINDLNNGSGTFNAMWTIFGIDTYNWEFRFTEGLKDNLVKTERQVIKTQVEVLDDFKTIIQNEYNNL